MIALRLPLVRPFRFTLPARLRTWLPNLMWACRWLGLGLALGALTDVVVRIVA